MHTHVFIYIYIYVYAHTQFTHTTSHTNTQGAMYAVGTACRVPLYVGPRVSPVCLSLSPACCVVYI